MFLVHLFLRLPFGEPAFLGHLSSAVLGALACASCNAARGYGARLPCRRWLRRCSSGSRSSFWSQAIITEAYYTLEHAAPLRGLRADAAGRATRGAGLSGRGHRPWGGGPRQPAVDGAGDAGTGPGSPAGVARGAPSAAAATRGGPGRRLLHYAWTVWLSHQGPAISFYGSHRFPGRHSGSTSAARATAATPESSSRLPSASSPPRRRSPRSSPPSAGPAGPAARRTACRRATAAK